MPTFVTPWVFGVAVVASLVVTGLHLLSVRTPPPLMLPTARFVPDGEARAVARQPRLNDVLLLILRVGALLAAGAALAGIRWPRTAASELRLVVADARWQQDSVWRDSVVRALSADEALVDMTFAAGVTRDAGASLVAAIRRATELTVQYPTLSRVNLTVVLPTHVTSVAGFAAWRTQWPGPVRVTRRGAGALEVVSADSGGVVVDVIGATRDDIVQAVFTGGQVVGNGARRVRVVRGRDTTGRDASSDGPVVRWPVSGDPAGWETIRGADSAFALVANGEVLVGPFVRTSRLSATVRTRIAAGDPVRILAWWSDGEPAAVERTGPDGRGCVRDVAVALPRAGDLLLSDAARGLRTTLLAPCGSAVVSTASLVDTALATDRYAPASAFRTGAVVAATSDPWWLAPLLLGLAVCGLLIEWLLRNRGADA